MKFHGNIATVIYFCTVQSLKYLLSVLYRKGLATPVVGQEWPLGTTVNGIIIISSPGVK